VSESSRNPRISKIDFFTQRERERERARESEKTDS
jgi:hypothetical protein